MNFEFSAEELALQAEARRFLQAQGTLSLNRAMLDGKGSAQAAKLWNQVAELGWPAATIPEAYGGLGLGHVALCAIAEEVGRAAAPLPLLPSIYLAAEALMQTGSESQKQRWLPKLASGDIIGTLALAGDFTFASGRISGDVSPVPQGVAASVAIVRASREDAAVGLYVVDLTQDGVSRAPVRTIDDSQPHARLVLASVCCEPLGETCDADDVMVRVTDRAAVLVAFEQVGGAEACLEAAVAYALQRRSFAKVIGSYQAVKHKLADMYIKKELAKSNAYYGGWALAKGARELPLAAATARVSAVDAYDFAAAENIQVHGGMGFTWEADCHIHYRRSRLLAHALGVASEWQDRLVAELDTLQSS